MALRPAADLHIRGEPQRSAAPLHGDGQPLSGIGIAERYAAGNRSRMRDASSSDLWEPISSGRRSANSSSTP